jgi:hypothetical protein
MPIAIVQRLSPSRVSAPSLQASTYKSLPGRSLGPPPTTSKRLLPNGQGDREYIINIVRHGEWPTGDCSESKEIIEMAADAKSRQEILFHQAAFGRQGVGQHSPPRSSSERPAGEWPVAGTSSPQRPCGRPVRTHSPAASGKKEVGAFSNSASTPRVATTRSSGRGTSPQVRGGSQPRGSSLSTSLPRATSGSPRAHSRSVGRRSSPTKAHSSPQAASPQHSPVSPRTSVAARKSKSPGARRKLPADAPAACPPRSKLADVAAACTPGNVARTSWPRRAAGTVSPAHPGASAAGGTRGSSPRPSHRHALLPARAIQVVNPPSTSPKASQSEANCEAKRVFRSSLESSLDEGKPVIQAPPPSPEICDSVRAEQALSVETMDVIWSDLSVELPAAIVASPEERRPALREIQPQVATTRSWKLASEKENDQNMPRKTLIASQSSSKLQASLGHFTPDANKTQRVLQRTEECRQLETFEMEQMCTPRRTQEKDPATPFGPNGRVSLHRMIPLSSSTQSTWSLCNSEESPGAYSKAISHALSTQSTWSLCKSEESPGDAPSAWSVGMSGSSLRVVDLEDMERTTSASARSRPNASRVDPGQPAIAARCASPSTPSTPVFGKAAAKDSTDSQTRPAERTVVAEACSRALDELRRNTSFLRLTVEEEFTRMCASAGAR